MDGTLTDTNRLIFASFNHVIGKYLGKTMEPREIIALFGPPEEGGLEKLLGAERVNIAMDDLCEFYAQHHPEMASLHAGVEEVLQFLKSRGIRLAVFTGKGIRTTTITLEALGLSRYFDLVVSGTDVVNYKPHPEGIRKVIATFDVKPEQVLMVGDALTDVRASRAAGVRIAAVVWDSYDRDGVLQADSDIVFHNVGEMMDWFRSHIN